MMNNFCGDGDESIELVAGMNYPTFTLGMYFPGQTLDRAVQAANEVIRRTMRRGANFRGEEFDLPVNLGWVVASEGGYIGDEGSSCWRLESHSGETMYVVTSEGDEKTSLEVARLKGFPVDDWGRW